MWYEKNSYKTAQENDPKQLLCKKMGIWSLVKCIIIWKNDEIVTNKLKKFKKTVIGHFFGFLRNIFKLNHITLPLLLPHAARNIIFLYEHDQKYTQDQTGPLNWFSCVFCWVSKIGPFLVVCKIFKLPSLGTF